MLSVTTQSLAYLQPAFVAQRSQRETLSQPKTSCPHCCVDLFISALGKHLVEDHTLPVSEALEVIATR